MDKAADKAVVTEDAIVSASESMDIGSLEEFEDADEGLAAL